LVFYMSVLSALLRRTYLGVSLWLSAPHFVRQGDSPPTQLSHLQALFSGSSLYSGLTVSN
jgi:hypothetical protein